MKTVRIDRHWHNWLIHLLGVLFMVGSAASVVVAHLILRDLWRVADEFGKGVISGAGIGAFAVLMLRRLGKGH